MRVPRPDQGPLQPPAVHGSPDPYGCRPGAAQEAHPRRLGHRGPRPRRAEREPAAGADRCAAALHPAARGHVRHGSWRADDAHLRGSAATGRTRVHGAAAAGPVVPAAGVRAPAVRGPAGPPAVRDAASASAVTGRPSLGRSASPHLRRAPGSRRRCRTRRTPRPRPTFRSPRRRRSTSSSRPPQYAPQQQAAPTAVRPADAAAVRTDLPARPAHGADEGEEEGRPAGSAAAWSSWSSSPSAPPSGSGTPPWPTAPFSRPPPPRWPSARA